MRKTLITIGIYLFIFLTGAAGLIYQVTWQKYLSRLLGSDSMATAIILATFPWRLIFRILFVRKINDKRKKPFYRICILGRHYRPLVFVLSTYFQDP